MKEVKRRIEGIKTVLFTEWNTSGRDFGIVLPLIYYFENILGWNVEFQSIFNLPAILKTSPDIVIMSNTVGSTWNVKMAELINDSSIPLFSHVSEGLFRENEIDGFLWGWNKKRKFNECIMSVWSMASYRMCINKYPQHSDKIKVSGSISFDKYKIFSFRRINSMGFKKVIGYAAFDFNNVSSSQKQIIINEMGQEHYNVLLSWLPIAQNILRYIVAKNPDIMFMVKPHPGDGQKYPLECRGLENMRNLTICRYDSSIMDVIYSSDIWLNINSTTNMEAWLLNKPSIAFNDSVKMNSSDVLYGAIIENDPSIINDLIQEYYQTGELQRFQAKANIREKLVEDLIQFNDGLNHIRFLSFVKPYIDEAESMRKYTVKWKLSPLAKIVGYARHYLYAISKIFHYIPIINKWSFRYLGFDTAQLEHEKSVRYPEYDSFYDLNSQKIKYLYDNYASKWDEALNVKK